MPRVLVIIPAYNESDTIEAVVGAVHKHVPDYDVVVVDDGSLDDTAARVSRMAGVQLIQMPYNLGIGASMQTGYTYALRHGYDVAVQCDGDGQHPVEQMGRLVERVANGDADMIIGSRYVADSDYSPTLGRRIGKSLLSRLINRLIGGGITDTTSGFRAMNREVLRAFATRYPEDYPEPEALIILHRFGLRAAEVPVDMLPRQGGETSIHTRRAIYYIIKVALAVFVDWFRSRETVSEDS